MFYTMNRLTASYEEGPGYGLDPPLERNNLTLSQLHHHPLQPLLELTRKSSFFKIRFNTVHAKFHEYLGKNNFLSAFKIGEKILLC